VSIGWRHQDRLVIRINGGKMKKLFALVVAMVVVTSTPIVLPSYAACTSSQESSIQRAQSAHQKNEQALSKENQALSKIQIKINDLKQKLNRAKPGSSSASGYQRQLDSALKDEGRALRRVSDAQKKYDRSLKDLSRAESCR
jgi:oligoendopeptidase F